MLRPFLQSLQRVATVSAFLTVDFHQARRVNQPLVRGFIEPRGLRHSFTQMMELKSAPANARHAGSRVAGMRAFWAYLRLFISAPHFTV